MNSPYYNSPAYCLSFMIDHRVVANFFMIIRYLELAKLDWLDIHNGIFELLENTLKINRHEERYGFAPLEDL